MDVTQFNTAAEYELALRTYLSHANGYYPVQIATGAMDPDDEEYQDYLYVRDHHELLIDQARWYEGQHNKPSLKIPVMANVQQKSQSTQVPHSGINFLTLCCWALGFGIATAGGFWFLCLIGGSIWLLSKLIKRNPKRS